MQHGVLLTSARVAIIFWAKEVCYADRNLEEAFHRKLDAGEFDVMRPRSTTENLNSLHHRLDDLQALLKRDPLLNASRHAPAAPAVTLAEETAEHEAAFQQVIAEADAFQAAGTLLLHTTMHTLLQLNTMPVCGHQFLCGSWFCSVYSFVHEIFRCQALEIFTKTNSSLSVKFSASNACHQHEWLAAGASVDVHAARLAADDQHDAGDQLQPSIDRGLICT